MIALLENHGGAIPEVLQEWGAPGAGRGLGMSLTRPGDPAVPAAADDGTEVHDQPLGVPDDLDPDDAPSPGLPESEPPNSG